MKKIFKWVIAIGISYFVLTTIYFGYSDIDSDKGVYKFYWSGLRGLWEDRPFGFAVNEIVETELDGTDGPYIISDSCFYVDSAGNFYEKEIDTNSFITVQTSCHELPAFVVELRDSIPVEKDSFEIPGKLIAISDIEGNFNGFFGFLLGNKVIDKRGNWTFGDGHLVLNGDFFDRGKQVTQVLWLIYHLENQAIKQGGKVHFILGNHEIMNLYGDVSYNDFKYMEVAKRISKQNDWDKGLRYLYAENSVLGKWLRTKNIVEKIGNDIFVHGGLNMYHSDNKYTIAEMNMISRKYNGIVPTEINIKSDRDRFVLSSVNSPYWDRRLNFDLKYKLMYKLNGIDASETTQAALDKILNFYGASKIIIGHSVVDDIETAYTNKVIKIDVKHGREINSGKTKGLLIENAGYYKVDDKGNKIQLCR